MDDKSSTCEDYIEKRWCDGSTITKGHKKCDDPAAVTCAGAPITGCCACGGGHWSSGHNIEGKPQVNPFPCSVYGGPLQILKTSPDDPYYSAVALNVSTGAWSLSGRNEITFFSANSRLNAAAMHHNRGDDTFTAWVIAEDRLCAIDAYTAVCYEEKVETWEGNTNFKIANAAVFVGDDYYYGRDYPQY